ncbi:SH3 domain-containing protein [Rhizobium acaciae]|uniref:SH3 domain-containing protein n=1 Tax=Rhizobium acaciae TaxID=2989736 RepID=UPI00221FEC7E|nr:SH3 domain-containing protein [Rhizobium acaciae]MCW1752932.1 SH3 domain-containing protein [Rhizobium acaciae]
MKNLFVKIAAAGMLMLAPAIAQAAEGYSTANVNMRAGPSTRYPAVAVIPAGSSVEIRGCLSDVNWCDVEFYGGRGWVSGQYVQALYQQRRVYVGPQYYRPLGIPMIRFSVDNYWDRYYRNRDFYRDRDRWSRGPDYYYRDRDNRDRDRDRDRNNRDRDRDWRDRDGRGQDRDRDRNRDWRDDNRRDDRRDNDRRVFDCRPGDPSCDP